MFRVHVLDGDAWHLVHETRDEQEARLRASLEASNDRRVWRVQSPDGRSVMTRVFT